ncbi:MAG: hypothetical protein ABFS10_11620, partial [Bacteroidota bacterium]
MRFATRFGVVSIVLINLHVLLYSQDTYTSAQSGIWASPATWSGAAGTPGSNDNIIILDGHTVSIATGGGESVIDVTINAGGVLDMQNRTLAVSGSFIVDGTVTSDDNSAKDLDFSGPTLGGTGIIAINDNNRYFNIGSNVSILSTTNLSLFGNIQIQNSVTVTNNGHIEVYGTLDGDNTTSSVWTNAADAELEVRGTLLSTGVLNASASGNTVTFIEEGIQSVKTPASSTYYNLVISGTGTKTISNNLTISHDISILSGTLDCNGNDLTVGGDWTNEGDFTEGTGTVTFSGTADQSIENASGEVFYDLTVNKSSGLLTLDGNVQTTTTLTMTAGVIDAGSNTLTLGSGLATPGTLTYTSGHINGLFERWINSVGTYTFPVGSSTNDQSVDITLNGIQTGGSLIAKFYDSAPGHADLPLFDSPDSVFNEFVDGYWSIDEGNGFNLGGSNDYSLNLDANGFSSFTIDGSTRVLTRSDGGSAWSAEGSHISATGSIAERSGLSTLPAEYALGDTTNCTRPSTSAITGSTTACTSDAGVTYSVTNNSPNTYAWVITGGSQASGGNANSITVNWGTVGMATGNVRVIESNTCTQGEPVDLTVTIHSIRPESVSGRTTVAENTSGEPYSVTNISGYTYTWTIIGGTQASGGTSNSITVDWGSNGTGYVSVVAQNGTCAAAPATQLEVNKYVIIESIASGDWTNTTTWDCGCVPIETDHVRINNPHTVTLTTGGGGTEVNNLLIEVGGTLDPDSKIMTIHGDFELNGTYLGGTKSLTMDGFGKYIDGVGSLGQGILLDANVYIESTAAIDIISGDLTVGTGVSVSNYGTINITENLVAADAAGTWVNENNAVLKVGDELFAGNGILDASAYGNTVAYNGTADQEIKIPSSTYYNLATEGSGSKTLPGAIDIDGGLLLAGTSILDVSTSNYTVNLAGNLYDLGGSLEEQQGTFILDGITDQQILGPGTFYNLTFSNSSDLHIHGHITVSNTLSMNGGNIFTLGNILTIGTDAANPGSISYASGVVVGQLERWIAATVTPYLFPIGTAGTYRPVTATFTSLGTGSVISEFIASDPGSTGLPLSEGSVNVTNQYSEGYWSLTANNGLTTTDYSLQLTATGFTSYTIIAGTRVITRPSGGSWVLDGVHAAASDPDLYRNNLTGGISSSGTEYSIGHVLCTGISIDRVITDVSCNGGNDGAIDITVSGGTTPYGFVWDHGPTTEDVTALTAGSYTVSLTDASGCTLDSTFTIAEPALLSATVSSVSVTCTAGNDGSITISSPAGGSGSYDYTIDGGTGWQASGSFTNLIAGTYDVRIRDASATTCEITLDGTLVLTEPNDAIAPIAACQDVTVQLDATGNATIAVIDIDNGSSDNCGIASMTLDITAFTCADAGANTVTLTVLDGSGNSNTCTSTVTVEDNIAPTFSIPADITIYSDASCAYDASVGVTGDVTDEADNCGVGDATYVDVVDNTDPCNIAITRTWSLVDDNGTSAASQDQTITVQDNIDPTASNPVAVNVECTADVPAVNIADVTDEADNCTAAPTVAHVSDVSDGNSCPEVITRTYSVTDDCGNTINVTQTITIDDITNPTASNPAAVNVECAADVPAVNIADVIDEADNCTAAPTVAHVSDVSDGNTCPEV